MLVHAVVVHDRDVAGFPLVADPVVHLGTLAVEDIEDRLVDVAVLLRLAAGPVLLEVDVQGLPEPVLGLHVVLGERLRSVIEPDVATAPHARQRAQTLELLGQIVFAADFADELAIGLVVVVLDRFLLVTHRGATLAISSSPGNTLSITLYFAAAATRGSMSFGSTVLPTVERTIALIVVGESFE